MGVPYSTGSTENKLGTAQGEREEEMDYREKFSSSLMERERERERERENKESWLAHPDVVYVSDKVSSAIFSHI